MISAVPRIVAAAALAFAAGCIERAPSPTERRERFDRATLRDVVAAAVPSGAARMGAKFGDAVELAAVEVSPARPKPGDQVQVTYYFRVLDDGEEDYKVFVHVDDRGGRAERINADHWPASGRYPTGAWKKGEIVRDVWTFKIPGFYNGEALDLWTGFYQPGKDDRWPLTNKGEVRNDGQNRVLAATIPVS